MASATRFSEQAGTEADFESSWNEQREKMHFLLLNPRVFNQLGHRGWGCHTHRRYLAGLIGSEGLYSVPGELTNWGYRAGGARPIGGRKATKLRG